MTITLSHGEKITASKEILNYLSIVFFEASNSYTSKGRNSLASTSLENSNIIYNELNKIGFYDNL